MIKKNQILKAYGTDWKEMTKLLLEQADLAKIISIKADQADPTGILSKKAVLSGASVPSGEISRLLSYKISSGETSPLLSDKISSAETSPLLSDKISYMQSNPKYKDLRIGIKPNLVCPTPADFGATTHPEIVAGIIEYLQSHGFYNLVVLEGSWVGDRTSDAYEYCGYRSMLEQYKVPFIDTQKERHHAAECAGMELHIVNAVDALDFLINVPVLKGHCQTHMTCALKNLKGLLPNSEKRRFHRMGLHKPIAHLNARIRPDFIVTDHICGDPSFEEGGNPLVRNGIFASVDPVLTDSYACQLLGVPVSDVAYVGLSERLGCGTSDLSHADIRTIYGTDNAEAILEDNLVPENAATAFSSAASSFPSSRVLDVSYAVEEVDSCSACYGNLIPALDRLKNEGLLDRLNTRIAIGQGHQGQRGILGVGKCTRLYEHSIPGCPPDSETIYRYLKDYILTRSS